MIGQRTREALATKRAQGVNLGLAVETVDVEAPASLGTVQAKLLAFLRAQRVEFRLTHHDPVTTSVEAAAVRGVELRSGAKAMLVKGKAGMVLAVLAEPSRV